MNLNNISIIDKLIIDSGELKNGITKMFIEGDKLNIIIDCE